MRQKEAKHDKVLIFEQMPVPATLTKMAIPTIISQLITLIYNMADTWFIGQTNNPYMVAASSLVLTVFMMTVALSNLFGVGGGTLTVRLLGSQQEDEAKKSSIAEPDHGRQRCVGFFRAVSDLHGAAAYDAGRQ